MDSKNTIYVLGAGFSAEAKCPLMKDFTDKKSIKWIENRLNKKDKKRFQNLKHYIFERMSLNYCKNIEEFLNHVAVADFLWMDSTTEHETHSYSSNKIFRDLQWYIVKLIQEKTKEHIPKLYDKFLTKIMEENSIIISFNYDLIVESVLKKLKKDYIYEPEKKLNKKLLILKLHGSGNWSYCGNCKEPTSYDNYIADKILSQKLLCTKCNKKNLEPIIVPPMLNKDYQDLTRGGDVIQRLWHIASIELLETEKIIFIGFSMNKSDLYVQELFKFCSNMNPSIKYEIVHPNPSEISSNYLHALVNREDNVEFRNMTFKEYVNLL